MRKTIRPFAEPRYTQVDNDLIEYIMPRVSCSAWKILTWIIRQTWGWANEESPTGRKQWDQISYSQFRKATGIKSDTTVRRALDDCLEAGYLLRRPSGDQQYEYRLNTTLEIEVDDTSTENEEVTSTENEEVESKTSTESVDTKETIKETPKEKEGADAPASVQARQKSLAGMPKRKNPQRPPQVQAWMRVFKFTPTTAQQEMIVEAVDDPRKWEKVLDAWVGQGYSPKNVTGQLDWYKDGIPQYARKGGPNGKDSNAAHSGHSAESEAEQIRAYALEKWNERQAKHFQQQ